MSLKISHVAFCDIFVEDCNNFTCAQCTDIFNSIKLAEEKFNSALRQPTGDKSKPADIMHWHHCECGAKECTTYCNSCGGYLY